MHYILGMEVWTREVRSRDPEDVQDDRIHDHTYGIEPEAIDCYFIRDSLCHDVSLDDLFLDVPDGYETRYLLCWEHIETCSLDGCKYDTNHKINLEGYMDLDWVVPLIGRALWGASLV